jgi:hypothetical protein
MTRKLNEADRAAVDLVFDRILSAADGKSSSGNGNGGDGVVVMTPAVSEERLSAVQRILGVLETMPAPEPPADLATRTLQGVARAAALDGATFTPAGPGQFIDPNQPMV